MQSTLPSTDGAAKFSSVPRPSLFINVPSITASILSCSTTAFSKSFNATIPAADEGTNPSAFLSYGLVMPHDDIIVM